MAITGALTLPQYALMSNDPLVTKITFSLLENGSVLTDIPFINRKTMYQNGVRFLGNLPSVTWARINDQITPVTATPTPFQEQAFVVRNSIPVDRLLLEDENAITDPRATQIQAYLKSVAYDYNDKFINNDHVAGDALAPVGLAYRIANGSTFGVHSDMSIDAGGVDLSSSGLTQATANTWLEYVQQTLDYMGAPEGDGVTLYMNDYLKRKFAHAVRLAGPGAGWDTTKDNFDRTVQLFKNAKVVDLGRKADQTTRVISPTENSDGTAGSSTYTSLYAVKYGEGHMQGWQYEPLSASVQDVGLIGGQGVTYTTVIDWAGGLYPESNRCLARVHGIKIA